jgi:hypothetical protein
MVTAGVVGGAATRGSAAARDDTHTSVVATQTSSGGAVLCATASAGAVVSTRFPIVPAGAVLLDDAVWVADETNAQAGLVKIGTSSGEVDEEIDIGAAAQTVVPGGGGSVWARTTDGVLVQVDTHTASVVRRVEPPKFPAHLVSAGRVLWAADGQGTVYRIDGRSGRLDDAVLQITGAESSSGGLPVVGALATNDEGDLWIALSGESVLLRVDRETNRVVDRIRYARRVPATAPYRPATVLAIAGDYGWVRIDDAPGTVEEASLVRVDLRNGKVRSFAPPDRLFTNVLTATERDVWLGGDTLEHFDPTTNRFRSVNVPPSAVSTAGGVRALDARSCSARSPRVPRPGRRGSRDVDPRGTPRLDDSELRDVEYSDLVVTELPPGFDSPPTTKNLAGSPFRLVLCNEEVDGPPTYVAGLDYARGGPEYVRQRVSGWLGDEANEIFDRARAAVDGCKRLNVSGTVFVPTASPPVPTDLGDEHLVLSRAVDDGSGLVFNDLLIRKGQFLYSASAETLLPDLAAGASAALDRAVER